VLRPFVDAECTQQRLERSPQPDLGRHQPRLRDYPDDKTATTGCGSTL
jgi:hypothetical protein